jgi:hypothetical protein
MQRDSIKDASPSWSPETFLKVEMLVLDSICLSASTLSNLVSLMTEISQLECRMSTVGHNIL